MTNHYTIRGSFTDREYLVVVEPQRLWLYQPNQWRQLETIGLSWQSGSGRDFRDGPLWWLALRVEFAVALREAKLRREVRRYDRARRFAERRNRG